MDSSSLPNEDIDNDPITDNEEEEDDISTVDNRGKKKTNTGKCGGSTTRSRTRSYVWEHYTRLKDNKNKCKCHYCQKDFSCPTKSGTTNLQKHLKCCKEFKAWEQSRAEKRKQEVLTPTGTDLKLSKVSEGIFREACNEMIVLGELPLAFIDSVAWRHFCNKVCLDKSHSRRTATRDIIEMFVQKKEAMKKWILANKQRVSLTTDIWTAPTTAASYMVVTLHFIDANWHLRKLIIGFKYVVDHKGSTIASTLLDCLADWGVEKVFTITVDNATANTSALRKFQDAFKLLRNDALVLDGEFMHMRCCAHIINLIVKDGLNEMSDHVEAIRNAVTYVRSSTKRLISFDQRLDEGKMTRGSLPLDVRTRWNSTHMMLKKAQQYRAAFDRMEAEDKLYNDYFMEVDNGKKRIGPPTYADWHAIDRLVKFLVIFYNSTLVVSASTSVCSHKCYGEIVTIEKNLRLLSTSSDMELKSKALNMLAKFDKYWGGFKEINKLLIVASVFDPTKKMQFAQLCFEKLYSKDSSESKQLYGSVYGVLMSMFKEYSTFYTTSSSTDGSSQSAGTESTGQENTAREGVVGSMDLFDDDIGYERMEFVYNDMVNEDGLEDAKNELDIYLKERVEHPKQNLFGTYFDVLSWWRRNSRRFPVLSEIARDVLAMQVSSVASESAFSTSGRILEPSRNGLNHNTIEVLICTQQWMKSEIQLKEKGAMTTQEMLADIELQDKLQKEFQTQFN